MKKLFFGLVLLGTVFIVLFVADNPSGAQEEITNNEKIKPEAIKQMQALIQEKQSRTAAQNKIESRLLFKIKMARNEMIADGVATLETGLTVDDRGYIDIEMTANVTKNLLKELDRLKAKIFVSLPEYRSITASVPITSIESLAALDEVIFIIPKQEMMLLQENKTSPANIPDNSVFNYNRPLAADHSADFEKRAQKVKDFIASNLNLSPESGSVNSQGDTTHGANTFRSTTGFNGTGIKIGVLSDGINSLAARQASGDLPVVNVLSGQAGSGDEGTAMLELVYDIAPGAQLYFASGFASSAQFAQNIRNLRAAGCNIIIDDISYPAETAFQNGQAANVFSPYNSGVVVQAVNDVTVGSQAGALYFSSAGNSGNKNDGTSGVWEGDFVDGGVASGIPGNLHNFGGAVFDTITGAGGHLVLQWSDPLGSSTNDYDLYVLNNAGTQILAVSNGNQTGTQDPIEFISSGASIAGNLVVVSKFSGAGRFLHINTNRGRLNFSTSGVVFGHNAGANTISIAATPAGPASADGIVFGPYPNLFNSGNKVERFSSDGPRRIFYNDNGTQLTPGNVSSTGGVLLQKPDITAADGTSTTTPNFIPFFGTSAAAPHAGALAALLKSACPTSTNTQLITAMKSTAIDIETVGTDRDSGAGIFMPIPARTALCGCSAIPIFISVGQTANGSLQSTDCTYPSDGSYYDAYTFNGTAGQQIYIAMSSIQFNTYLLLYQGNYPGGTFITQDDNGGGGTNSRIPATSGFLTLPATGTYTILANSSTSGMTGTYSLTLGTTCTYILNPTSVSVSSSSTTGSISVTTASGCAWTAASNNTSWLTLTGATSGTLSGTVTYAVAANTGAARTGTMTIGGQTVTVNQAAPSTPTAIGKHFDFDGDRKTDVGIFRPSSGQWWYLRSSDSASRAAQFGTSTDVRVPADYTGDGKVDIAFWRPSTGQWFIIRSEDGSFYAFPFGASGDIPAPGDFDRDGRADAAVFRPSNGGWYILLATGGTISQQFGIAEDKPVVADYDGDGRDDIAVFRPSSAQWWISRSSGGVLSAQFGAAGDKTVQGDYTGDGKADIAFWRPSNGNWYILRSENFSFYGFPFGTNGDIPAPGDYDGDGKFDPAVFRTSNSAFYMQRSLSGFIAVGFGTSGDQPIAASFVR